MIILKKKHNLVVEKLQKDIERLEELNNKQLKEVKRLARTKMDLLAKIDKKNTLNSFYLEENEKLKDRNDELNTELVSEKAKVLQLEEANHQLHQEVEEFETQIEKYEKTIDSLGKTYNKMNRKLWANTEAQRQMRKLSDNLLESERFNKSSLSKYIYDLSMLIGGGEVFEYVGIKSKVEDHIDA